MPPGNVPPQHLNNMPTLTDQMKKMSVAEIEEQMRRRQPPNQPQGYPPQQNFPPNFQQNFPPQQQQQNFSGHPQQIQQRGCAEFSEPNAAAERPAADIDTATRVDTASNYVAGLYKCLRLPISICISRRWDLLPTLPTISQSFPRNTIFPPSVPRLPRIPTHHHRCDRLCSRTRAPQQRTQQQGFAPKNTQPFRTKWKESKSMMTADEIDSIMRCAVFNFLSSLRVFCEFFCECSDLVVGCRRLN